MENIQLVISDINLGRMILATILFLLLAFAIIREVKGEFSSPKEELPEGYKHLSAITEEELRSYKRWSLLLTDRSTMTVVGVLGGIIELHPILGYKAIK